MSIDRPRAVVLLSGGLDSATVLAIASQEYDCTTLSFDYGQRHRSELEAAARISSGSGSEHRLIVLDPNVLRASALTDDSIAVPVQPQDGIPVTYVPARNTVFLAHALAVAEVLGSQDIFIGVNAIDYSGYPDCRPEYISAFEGMANLATKVAVEGGRVRIRTPLIDLTKAEIIQRGLDLNVDYTQTVSCYQADDAGRACGVCDSCRFRRAGFEQAGAEDQTRYID